MFGPPAWWAHGFTCGQNRMQIFCSGFRAMFFFGHTFLLLLRPKSPDRSVPDSNNTLYIWNRRSRLYSSCLARICWPTERNCMRDTCRATYIGRWKTPTFLLLHRKLGTYYDIWYEDYVITLCYTGEPCWWKVGIMLIGLMSIYVHIHLTLCWSLVAHTTADK